MNKCPTAKCQVILSKELVIVKMNDKHRQIEDWLEKIFGSEAVPGYEVNSVTVETLYQLMKRNEKRDDFTALITTDRLQKANEYNVEADRLGRILEKLGLEPSCLSQSGSVSLRTLVNVCLLLNTKDASNTCLLLALSEACQESLKLKEARQREQSISAQLLCNTSSAMRHANYLKKALQGLEEQVKHQAPELEKKSKQAGFLHTKGKEYKSNIQSLKKDLMSSGADPSLYHNALMQKAEELQKLKTKLHPLRAKLDTYHKLPPDLDLARVKVEEARQELQRLEQELASHINLMHM